MAFISWNETLSVGIPSLDAQHRALIALINALHDAMSRGEGARVLGAPFRQVLSYAGTHFAAEEKLFSRHAYPSAPAHQKEHAALTEKALQLKAEFESGKPATVIATMEFLRDWLNHHIKSVDKQYGPFLAGKGEK